MAAPIIQLVELTKKYGNFIAVNNLSLTIEKGEIFGLLGPNGAGKSTTILMMLGLTEPTSGYVEVCGVNSTTNPIEVKKKVGYLPEDVGFYEDMSGIENLIYTARLNCIPANEARKKAEELMVRVGLVNEINKKTGKYSKGMRQRLGLADVLIKNPEVIILDEPTSGIDPKGVQDFLELIVELRNEHGINVLFSSHNLHQVQQVCDRIGIFVEGKLLAEGNIESLSRKLFTKGMYLFEIGIDSLKHPEAKLDSEAKLQDLLKPIEGINSIYYEEGVFKIQCSEDILSKIAQRIIEKGNDISFLNRKQIGLDVIYNKYFEKEIK